MAPRSTTNKQKVEQGVLKDLCKGIFREIGVENKEGSERTIEQAVGWYLKLIEYRLREIDQETLEFSTNYARDLLDSENIDRLCLRECEKLYSMLPREHFLLKSCPPSHSKNGAVMTEKGDGGSKAKKLEGNFIGNPLVGEFDGKNSSWPLWKSMFEKGVHECSELSSETKLFYLVSNIRENGLADRLVANFTGIKNAYEPAWNDLNNHYEAASNLKTPHMLGLRDLKKRFKVEDPCKSRQLENLHQLEAI